MTRDDIKTRLKADGRYRLFNAAVERLMAEGKTEKAAFIAAATEFGLLVDGAIPDPSPEELAGRRPRSDKKTPWSNKPPSTQAEDDEWVYKNLANMEITEERSPSAGAWGMLLSIRDQPTLKTAFFQKWWKDHQTVTDAESRFKDDGRVVLDVIEDLLRAETAKEIKA
jgi:hypothetical protein